MKGGLDPANGFGYRADLDEARFSRPWRLNPRNGKQLLKKSTFLRHLGQTAWDVYLGDLRYRNCLQGAEAVKYGECWDGAEAASRRLKGVTKHQVNHARAKLQSVGLERGEWRFRDGKQVYVRTIYGNLARDGKNLLVPLRVRNEVCARPGHGGKRANSGGARRGAGRPRKAPAGPSSGIQQEANRIQQDANDLLLLPTEVVVAVQASLPLPSEEERKRAPSGAPSFSSEEKPMPSEQPLASFSEMLTANRPAKRPVPPAAQTLIPPPPSDGQINAPLVPRPPDLPEDISEDYEILSCAYSGAVRHITGKEPSAYAKRHMTLSQLQRSLGESSTLLREHRLPPILWAVWSVRAFQAIQQRAHPGRKKISPPALAWVFNPKRIAKHHGWCRHEMGSELGGTLCIPPSALELQRRWWLMRSDVDRLTEPTVENVRSAVDAWFPAGLYDRLVAQAVAEASAKREALAQGLARGDWLWG